MSRSKKLEAELKAIQDKIGQAVINSASVEVDQLLAKEYLIRDRLGLLEQPGPHRQTGLTEALILEFIGRSGQPVVWSDVWQHTGNRGGLPKFRRRLEDERSIASQGDGYVLKPHGRKRLAELCSRF